MTTPHRLNDDKSTSPNNKESVAHAVGLVTETETAADPAATLEYEERPNNNNTQESLLGAEDYYSSQPDADDPYWTRHLTTEDPNIRKQIAFPSGDVHYYHHRQSNNAAAADDQRNNDGIEEQPRGGGTNGTEENVLNAEEEFSMFEPNRAVPSTSGSPLSAPRPSYTLLNWVSGIADMFVLQIPDQVISTEDRLLLESVHGYFHEEREECTENDPSVQPLREAWEDVRKYILTTEGKWFGAKRFPDSGTTELDAYCSFIYFTGYDKKKKNYQHRNSVASDDITASKDKKRPLVPETMETAAAAAVAEVTGEMPDAKRARGQQED